MAHSVHQPVHLNTIHIESLAQ